MSTYNDVVMAVSWLSSYNNVVMAVSWMSSYTDVVMAVDYPEEFTITFALQNPQSKCWPTYHQLQMLTIGSHYLGYDHHFKKEKRLPRRKCRIDTERKRRAAGEKKPETRIGLRNMSNQK
ncbi:hypothetical protein Btru_044783 [Bulinus truncatus]|nr:hypothetical protein Btru_044783 [Bulinus truncatus]